MKLFYFSLILIIFIAGCSNQTISYDNPYIKNKTFKKNKLKKDKLECELEAYRLVPPSYTRSYHTYSSPNNYKGTFKIVNPYTGVVSNGTYSTQNTNSYMTGYNKTLNMYKRGRENARVSKMYSLRRRAYNMCLGKRGWKIIK